jgi:prevent-host-death family protein
MTTMAQTKSIPVPATEFKAKCLEMLDTVSRKRTSITISKRGKPVARLVPMDDQPIPSIFGRMKGKMTILGDIVSPDPEVWDSEK